MSCKFRLYTDGSYSEVGNIVSGGFILLDNDEKFLMGQRIFSRRTEYLKSRNVSGELLAVMVGLETVASLLDECELILYYDYAGIENFATGRWLNIKSGIAKLYMESLKSIRHRYPGLKLQFRKVKAHTGDFWNESVDALVSGRRKFSGEGWLPEMEL